MTEWRFEYDEDLLDACAGSPKEKPVDASCMSLFIQHQRHFYGVDPVLGENLAPHMHRKLDNFVRNVRFIHRHNGLKNGGHKVALNRFADHNLDTVLSSDDVGDWHRWLRAEEDSLESTFLESNVQSDLAGILTPLADIESIKGVAANLTIGKGSFNKLQPSYHSHKSSKKLYDTLSDTFVDVPVSPEQGEFQTPQNEGSDSDGGLLSVKRNPDYRRRRHGVPVHDANPQRGFDVYLNWATQDNPDGVPIVHGSFDQGTCGSCWAFAAAGSLEASAARHEAYFGYHDHMEEHFITINNFTDLKNEAVAKAQEIEESAFRMLNLSVQELVDCDTFADQGCTGGNPLLAYYFIHRYGLTTWNRYPYVGFQDTCHKQNVRHPVASVKSWGVVSPNHENHMELTLRYVGPIAVGINGNHPSFLAYSGGIFNSASCKQGANHALLIVGYGQEEDYEGETTRYWIARNSWGKGWGEDGFVRIARQSQGFKGVPGVCGIARSPSVAIGGFLIETEGLASMNRDPSPTLEKFEYSIMDDLCEFTNLGLEGTCGKFADWVDTHQAPLLGMLGVILGLLAIWPLSKDCRRRRQRRLERQRRKMNGANGSGADLSEEVTPLVSSAVNGVDYGASSETSPPP